MCSNVESIHKQCDDDCANSFSVSFASSLSLSVSADYVVFFFGNLCGIQNQLQKGFSSMNRWMTQKSRTESSNKKTRKPLEKRTTKTPTIEMNIKSKPRKRHEKLYAFIEKCEWPEIDCKKNQQREHNSHMHTNSR